MTKYFEDFELGEEVEGKQSYELKTEEIVAFSSRWDPHAFHTDSEGAENAEIGLGYDQVRFFAPGCIGDRLQYSSVLSEKRPSKSKPHLGVITFTMMLHNQDGEKVLSCTTSALFRRRTRQRQAPA